MSQGKFAGLQQIEQKNRVRISGMRSDPAFSQYTIFLRKSAHHRAVAILHEKNEGTVFSELVQELLEGWLEKNR